MLAYHFLILMCDYYEELDYMRLDLLLLQTEIRFVIINLL